MMKTRRNLLLKCSIFINIAVLLYICSHVMINSSSITLGPGYIIQDDGGKQQQQIVVLQQQQRQLQDTKSDGLTNLNDNDRTINSNSMPSGKRSPIINELNQSKDSVAVAPQQGPYLAGEQLGGDVIEKSSNEIVLEPQSNNPDAAGSIPNDGLSDTIYTNDSIVSTHDLELELRLHTLIKCHNKDYVPEIIQRGDFWVLKNYIRAEHGELRCFETVTYTTHSDYTFLDNVIPLLERWNAPLSVAMHAPGTDFMPTLNSIKYLRDCAPNGELVRKYVTFHIYFSSKHIPKQVPKHDVALKQPYNCTLPPPYQNITTAQMYKSIKKLLYPVNVGRNIARDAAMTHFILASDIELYPNPGLAKRFLEMMARNDAPLRRKNPRVYPLPIFEVDENSPVPVDKTELQDMLRKGKAIPFHKRVCSSCHGVPKSKEWIAANETEDLAIFHIGKRVGYFVHWEPIYIGTHSDPHYDERLSWEGKSDKMTQGYALCVLDYEFHILNNAFLVHKPGIKVLKNDPKRAVLAAKTNQLIRKIIYPELQAMYGVRKGCAV